MRLSMRLTLAMTALVLGAVAGVTTLAYYDIGRAVVPAGIQRLSDQAKARLGVISVMFRAVSNEVLAARTLPAHDGLMRARLNGGVDPQDGLSEERWRRHLAAAYAGQMSAKPGILHYRYIGAADGGREWVRVDRVGGDGAIRIVPDAELQRHGDEAFFRRALASPDAELHLSWAQAGAAAGGDAAATIVTAAAQVRDASGAVFGLVVLDIDIAPTFERSRAALSEDTKAYIVDAAGPYLVNLREGRIVPTGHVRRWQDDFPQLAAALGSGNGAAAVLTAPDGQRVAAVIGLATLPGGPRVGVIETAAFDSIIAPATALQSSALIVALFAALAAVALSVLLSRSLAKPVVRITAAVEDLTATGRLVMPKRLSGEARILASAFEQMVGKIEAATAALRSKSELLDKTIASMADAVVVLDAGGRQLIVNPPFTALFGADADLCSEAWLRKYPRYRADGVTPLSEAESPAARASRGESFDNVELAFRRPGESELVLLAASGRRIENADGSYGGAVIVYRNLTELKETERQLRQAQKMQAIGQLTGGVAHDLNNILTIVTGGIELLTEGVADRPALKDVARMIDDAVTRASDLTSRLLAFSRKQPLQPRSIDVDVLMRDTVKLLRPTFDARIEIEVDAPPDLSPALADPSQLGSALINLAVNARDAMPNGGKLHFEAANVDLDQAYAAQHDEVTAGRYVMLAVSDTGCGMPQAVRERVFEPFFTTKAVGEGTGLGLSMVYGFVKQSGGHIELYSEEGCGTTIRLYLPSAAAQAESSDAPPRMRGGREVVLVVEDDALVRSYVMTHLTALGYTVHPAGTAAEALALAQDGLAFDLLFTDVILGGAMNGPQLADELRKMRPGLKVLFTSGYSENAMIDQGRLAAGMRLLPKPYRRAELAQVLRQVLDVPAAATRAA